MLHSAQFAILPMSILILIWAQIDRFPPKGVIWVFSTWQWHPTPIGCRSALPYCTRIRLPIFSTWEKMSPTFAFATVELPLA